MTKTIQIAEPWIGTEEYEALKHPLETGWLTQGPKVNAFEKAFAKLHQVNHAFAVTSCTTGLHLALAALGIGPGDEVIVPSFTWVASANVVLYCGATPVLVDVDTDTFNISAESVKAHITGKTKAIMPVHLFGLCADMDAIRAVIPDHVHIIEDAACAAGAQYKGVYAGALGGAGVFSFHPRKSITTGEGGMVTAQDDALAERLQQMRNHGATISEEQRHHGPKPYILPDFNLLGFNYRMTDLQGAVGLVQLQRLNQFIDERAKWAQFYSESLSDVDWLRCSKEPESGRHGWQSFVTYVNPDNAPMARNDLMEHLQSKGISTRPGTHAVHTLNYYKERFGYEADSLPGAKACAENTMAIPLHNKMTESDYQYIVEVLKAV